MRSSRRALIQEANAARALPRIQTCMRLELWHDREEIEPDFRQRIADHVDIRHPEIRIFDPEIGSVMVCTPILVADVRSLTVVDPVSATRADLFPELAQLQRDAAVLAGKLKDAEVAVAEASGRDPSEQVRVVLDPAGRIEHVEVEPQWRSHLDAMTSADG